MEAIIVNIVPSAAKAAFPGMYRQMFCLSAIIPISPVNRNKNIYFSFFFGYFDEEKPTFATVSVTFHIQKAKFHSPSAAFVSPEETRTIFSLASVNFSS